MKKNFLFTLPSLKATFSPTTSIYRLLTSLVVVEGKVEEIRLKVSSKRDEGESDIHFIPCGGRGREKKSPLST